MCACLRALAWPSAFCYMTSIKDRTCLLLGAAHLWRGCQPPHYVWWLCYEQSCGLKHSLHSGTAQHFIQAVVKLQGWKKWQYHNDCNNRHACVSCRLHHLQETEFHVPQPSSPPATGG